MTVSIAICLVLQFASLAVLVFGDIGFDLPGRYGLSFNHGIFFAVCYIGSLLAGFVFAIKKRSWRIASLQIAIPVILVAFQLRPAPQYRALDYQYLVGKSEDEVQNTLSSRLAVSGIQKVSGIQDDREFTSYRGMTVFYDKNGYVTSVEGNRR